MLLTADSIAVTQANRRRTANGWHTTFIGQNRNTLKAGESAPADETLYPMAFLVEKDPGAVVKPHFHQADQYQVIVQGSGRLGIHDIGTVAVHYTDAFSAYGPIVAGEEGVSWFTLRNAWDPGARYMPQHRMQLREARARYQHREATCGPVAPFREADLTRLGETEENELIETSPDGLGTWRYTVAPGQSIDGRDPATGGGQFWIVTAGSAGLPNSSCFPVNSCIFVGPHDAALRLSAGTSGADLLCLQFPKRAWQ